MIKTVASKKIKMEQETLFTASKWDILKMLSSGSKSPLQLAKLSNTSVANISQQIRLLEMAGLVQCTRISNRDKGQPRLLYSLVGNQSFLIASTTDFVEKKFLNLTEYNKIILKIWFLDRPELHYFLEKMFWHIEPKVNLISAILLDKELSQSEDIYVTLLSDDSELKKELKKISIKNKDGISRNVLFNVKNKNELKRINGVESKFYALYDPSNLLGSIKDKVMEEGK
jgi:predicted transcriptional regulator